MDIYGQHSLSTVTISTLCQRHIIAISTRHGSGSHFVLKKDERKAKRPGESAARGDLCYGLLQGLEGGGSRQQQLDPLG